MPLTIQQIVSTAEPQAWHALAEALGMVALPGGPDTSGSDDWRTFGANGVLAVHRVAEPARARVELSLLAEDLDGLADALGDRARRDALDDIGPMLVVEGPPPFTATIAADGATAADSPLSVMPIWYGSDLEAPGRLLRTAGLRPRLASDSGGWLDFTAPGGGLVALHRSTERSDVEASFEYSGRLEDLAERLAAAGHEPRIVDEAYNRTLLVPTPEGRDLWVNGAQDDLYGYTRVE